MVLVGVTLLHAVWDTNKVFQHAGSFVRGKLKIILVTATFQVIMVDSDFKAVEIT